MGPSARRKHVCPGGQLPPLRRPAAARLRQGAGPGPRRGPGAARGEHARRGPLDGAAGVSRRPASSPSCSSNTSQRSSRSVSTRRFRAPRSFPDGVVTFLFVDIDGSTPIVQPATATPMSRRCWSRTADGRRVDARGARRRGRPLRGRRRVLRVSDRLPRPPTQPSTCTVVWRNAPHRGDRRPRPDRPAYGARTSASLTNYAAVRGAPRREDRRRGQRWSDPRHGRPPAVLLEQASSERLVPSSSSARSRSRASTATEPLSQLNAPGLVEELLPSRAPGASAPSACPPELTSLVGREAEIAEHRLRASIAS